MYVGGNLRWVSLFYSDASGISESRFGWVQVDPYERVTFSQVEIYERVGKSVIVVCKKGPKGLTVEFYGYKKSRKPSGFGINSYLKDGAFTAVKRDAKF